MLLGFALSCGITLQAAINLLAVSGSAPTKGMPAPFISYGGSNLISCLLATALILSIGFDQIEPGYSDKLTSKLPWNRKRR
jgi:cell division protein FtsW